MCSDLSGYSRKTSRRRHRVTINVSGEMFETYEETLARFPTTLLGDKQKCQKYFCYSTQQYFFQRSRLCFESILHFYQSNGTLNCPQGIDIDLFGDECRFFSIPNIFIDSMKRKEGIFPDLKQRNEVESKNISLRLRIWNILENPDTSDGAWYFGMTSLLIVWLSIVSASVETVPSFNVGKVWGILELSINIWFLLELLLRITFSDNLLKFLTQTMNVIDVLAILPYFLLLVTGTNSIGSVIGILKTLKFVRVCRLFRFSKHSLRLKVAGKILHASLGNFRLLMLCLFIVITLGGTVMYLIEYQQEESGFDSIPASLWWSVQTITSVGYGDLIPKTLLGRVLASGFMLLGVATISLPILTIVTQFAVLYPKNIESESFGNELGNLGGNDGTMHIPRGLESIKRKISVRQGSYRK